MFPSGGLCDFNSNKSNFLSLKLQKETTQEGIEMYKILIALLIISCFLLNSVSTLAQQKTVPAQERSSSAFKAKKEKAEKKIKEIESYVKKIDKEKRIHKGDAENLDRLINEHIESVNTAVKQTFADAEEAKNSDGQKGSVKSFLEFENMAKNHEKRAKAVHAKLEEIEKKIKEGDVELDKSLIESMTPDERKEYMKSMTPNGREKMKKKHPKLLSSISIDADMNFIDMKKIGESVSAFCACLPEEFINFFVSPAEASIGAGVAVACGGSYGIACPLAILGAVVAYTQAYEYMINCMERQCSCVWYRPWCCSGRTWCWSVYIAWCA